MKGGSQSCGMLCQPPWTSPSFFFLFVGESSQDKTATWSASSRTPPRTPGDRSSSFLLFSFFFLLPLFSEIAVLKVLIEDLRIARPASAGNASTDGIFFFSFPPLSLPPSLLINLEATSSAPEKTSRLGLLVKSWGGRSDWNRFSR